MAGNFNLEQYETVKTRKKKFYSDFKDGRIVVECVRIESKEAVFKASIFKSKEEQLENAPFSTGYAQEFQGQGGFANKFAWAENCEESAIGRALDNAGYASNDKCSREEMLKVMAKEMEQGKTTIVNNQKPQQTTNNNQQQYKPNPNKKVTENQLKRLFAITKKNEWSNDDVKGLMKYKFNIESSKDLNQEQYEFVCSSIEKYNNVKDLLKEEVGTADQLQNEKQPKWDDDVPF